MRKLLLRPASAAVLAVILPCFGCGDEAQEPPVVEVYSGELRFAKFQQAFPTWDTATDFVTLRVEGGTYNLDHLTGGSNLCSSIGQIVNFGRRTMRLIPTSVLYVQQCDTLHIPGGVFSTEFKGDSLIVGPDKHTFEWDDTVQHDPLIVRHYTDTVMYHFRLSR